MDANEADAVNASNIDGVIAFAKDFSLATGAVIAITGATDIVTDGKRVCIISNGHPIMGKITGAGCMLSAMTCAYVVANQNDVFEAVCTSLIAMGIAGEIAYKRMGSLDGNSSFRNYLIDAVYNLTSEQLHESARYELR